MHWIVAALITALCWSNGSAWALGITNLQVSSGESYQVRDASLQVGELVYVDRSYTFTEVPSPLLGATYIQTANDDKASVTASLLTFTVDRPVTVYVGHDVRRTTKPTWLSDWAALTFGWRSTDTGFDVFSKDFSLGLVVLSGNEGGGKSMYVVAIVPTVPGSPPAQVSAPTVTIEVVEVLSSLLTWNANSESDLAGYRVYRTTTPGVYSGILAEVTEPQYTDMNINPGVTYFYVVTAFDNVNNESGVSNEVSKTF